MLSNFSLVLLGLLTLPAVDVEVSTLGGGKMAGKLVQLQADNLTVEAADGAKTIELRTVVGINVAGPAPEASPLPVRVELIDGSAILSESYSAKGGRATLKVGGADLELRTRLIRAVRFRPAQEAVDALWQAQLEAKAEGDLIVIRKTSKTATDAASSVVLDRQAGVIHEVTDATVQLELDGDKIPVKRERLEGLLYFHPSERELPDPLCVVEEHSGTRWQLKSIKIADDVGQFETTGGLSVSVPLPRIKRLDFSKGNVLQLSEVDPESVEWAPFFLSKAAVQSLTKLYQPRRDRSFDGGPLQLGNQSYEKGLAVHSRTQMVFRVPKGFRRFQALVGIDDRVREAGHVKLVVQADGKTLFDEPVTGKDKPRELDLDIAGCRRLTILVDFGEELDIADHLNLCNARITK